MKDQILEILSRSNVFLTGGGGVGKSYLTASIIRHYKENFKNVVILGSTGISAVSLGGVSLHSFFKFGYCKDYEELRRLDYRQKDKLISCHPCKKSKVRANFLTFYTLLTPVRGRI